MHGEQDGDWLEGMGGSDTLRGGAGIDLLALDLAYAADGIIRDVLDGHDLERDPTGSEDDSADILLAVGDAAEDANGNRLFHDDIKLSRAANGDLQIEYRAHAAAERVGDPAFSNTFTAAWLTTVEQVQIAGLMGDDLLDARGLPDAGSLDWTAILSGGPGSDVLLGSGGRDRLDGGSGSDHLYGFGGDDRLWGDFGDRGAATDTDALFAGAGNDDLVGARGNANRMYAWGVAPTFDPDAPTPPAGFGDLNLPTFDPGQNTGVNRMLGGDADDALFGGNGLDLLYGAGGTDALFTKTGAAVGAGGNPLAGDTGTEEDDAWKKYAQQTDAVWYVGRQQGHVGRPGHHGPGAGRVRRQPLQSRLRPALRRDQAVRQQRTGTRRRTVLQPHPHRGDRGRERRSRRARPDLQRRRLLRRRQGQGYAYDPATGQLTRRLSADRRDNARRGVTKTAIVGAVPETEPEDSVVGTVLPPETDYLAILIDTGAGNDEVYVGGQVQKDVWIDAGAGHDFVRVASSDAVVRTDRTDGHLTGRYAPDSDTAPGRGNDTAATAFDLTTAKVGDREIGPIGGPVGGSGAGSVRFSGLTIDSASPGAADAGSETDWYAFSFAAGTVFTAGDTIRAAGVVGSRPGDGPPATLRLGLFLPGAGDDPPTRIGDWAEDGTLEIGSLGLAAGTRYLVRVDSANGRLTEYDFAFRLAASADRTERDPAARDLPAPDAVSRVGGLTIHGAEDADRFRFRPATAAGVVTLEHGGGGSVRLTLQTADGEEIAETLAAGADAALDLAAAFDGSTAARTFDANAAYFLHVSSGDGAPAHYALAFAGFADAAANLAGAGTEADPLRLVSTADDLLTLAGLTRTVPAGEAVHFALDLASAPPAGSGLTLFADAAVEVLLRERLADGSLSGPLPGSSAGADSAAAIGLDRRALGLEEDDPWPARLLLTVRAVGESESGAALPAAIRLASATAAAESLVRDLGDPRIVDLSAAVGPNGERRPTARHVLIGGSGNDRLLGGGGEDWIFGGEDDDVLSGGLDFQAEDLILGEGGNDTFLIAPDFLPEKLRPDGTVGRYDAGTADLFVGGDGFDQAYYLGADTFEDGSGGSVAGWDYVMLGFDRLLGRHRVSALALDRDTNRFAAVDEGADAAFLQTYASFRARDVDRTVVNTRGGKDVVRADPGYVLNGASWGIAAGDVAAGATAFGEVLIVGGEGEDALFGGASDDVLLGGSLARNDAEADNDFLVGGSGNDVLLGGSGDDRQAGGAVWPVDDWNPFLQGGTGGIYRPFDGTPADDDLHAGDTADGAGAFAWYSPLRDVAPGQFDAADFTFEGRGDVTGVTIGGLGDGTESLGERLRPGRPHRLAGTGAVRGGRRSERRWADRLRRRRGGRRRLRPLRPARSERPLAGRPDRAGQQARRAGAGDAVGVRDGPVLQQPRRRRTERPGRHRPRRRPGRPDPGRRPGPLRRGRRLRRGRGERTAVRRLGFGGGT